MDSNQQLQLTGQVLSGGSQAEPPVPSMPVCIPIAGAHVSLLYATEGIPAEIGHTRTDEQGRFTLSVSPPPADGIFYVAAWTEPEWVRLVAVVGPTLAGPVTVNELTTVAAAYAFAQFTAASQISGPAASLRVAAGMCANLASITGDPSNVMLGAPNGDQTNSLRSLRNLANLLVPAVRGSGGDWHEVHELATPPRGDPPADTFQAMVNIARHPGWHVAGIYRQSQSMQLYSPALAVPPDAWTLAVKVNRTGDDGTRKFGGPANISWDRHGNAWISNNVVQGESAGCDFAVVLKPDGTPADGVDGPKSPVVGGGMNGPGFGVVVDRNGDAWIGSYGWGPKGSWPVTGVVSKFDGSGNNIGGDGYTQGTSRVQGMAVDRWNNLWIASYGNDEVTPPPPYLNTVSVYLGGDPGNCISYPDPDASPPQTAPGMYTFGVAVDQTAEVPTAWVTYGGGLGWPKANPAHVARFVIENGALRCTLALQVGASSKAIALDPKGNAWIASGGDDTVYMVTPAGHVAGFTDRGGLNSPWGLTVDGNGDVWVGNFGHLGILYDYTHAAVSKLAGADSPSGLPVGEPISPETGYTLPTAGDPVTLADGSPLYKDGTPCYSPLMRMTSVTIDAAGNLWAVNNWKPRFATDFEPGSGNPGGDGIVIFVGVAKPPA
ncbi:MAG: hypothetical protein ACJ8GN_06230 [Longimicrobiaceae bacterium]